MSVTRPRIRALMATDTDPQRVSLLADVDCRIERANERVMNGQYESAHDIMQQIDAQLQHLGLAHLQLPGTGQLLGNAPTVSALMPAGGLPDNAAGGPQRRDQQMVVADLCATLQIPRTPQLTSKRTLETSTSNAAQVVEAKRSKTKIPIGTIIHGMSLVSMLNLEKEYK